MTELTGDTAAHGTRAHDPAPHFDGYPYLALWLTDDCAHLVCLPRGTDAQLLAWTRGAHAATGLAVHLVAGRERSTLVDAFGECGRAAFIPSRVAVDDQIEPTVLTRPDPEQAERSRRLAEFCAARAAQGHDVASLGATQLQRLRATVERVRVRRYRSAPAPLDHRASL